MRNSPLKAFANSQGLSASVTLYRIKHVLVNIELSV